MKKILTSVAMVLLLAGCAKEYDDSGIKARLDAVETKLNELEGNIMALQSAIGEGVFVAKVQEHIDAESGKTDGVTITYTNGDVKWFKIETNVADVNDPVIGVISSGSGSLVWAVNGTAILIDGKEVPVYQTPVFSLDDEGYLWVEVDGKKTKLGQVKNEGATLKDGIFTDIKVVEDAEGKRVVLTLSDNSIVNIPFAEAFELIVQETDFVYEEVAPIQIPFNVTAATAKTVVGVAGYDPTDFEVTVDMDAKIIEVTPQWPAASGVFMAYADSKIGLTSIVTVSVAPIRINPVDPDAEYDPETGIYVNYFAEADAGSVDVQVVSNVPFQVVPLVDWITVADNTKALKKYSLPLLLADNKTKDYRDGKVILIKADANPASYEDDDILQSIIIRQLAPLGGPADLSKVESANSYLIYAPGDYKFKAVKGNSAESVGTVASVDVLWETYNDNQTVAANSIIASASFENGYITFSTPNTLKAGNALIAAKDADGKILWSWHIWVPETEIAVGTYGFSSSIKMMDRNLGALHVAVPGSVDAASCGLYYQWGRKDPFMPIGSFADKTVATTAPAGVWSTESAQFTIQQGIEKPTVFAYGSSDWTSEPNDNLWTDDAKTQYDPCPVGYKVAKYGDPKLFDYVTAANYDAWAWNADCVTAGTVADGTTILPYNGLIYYSSGNYDGVAARVRLWTSTQKGAGAARALDLKSSDQSTSGTGQKRASGNGIRCIVVDESAIVPPTPDPKPETPAIDLSETATANCYIVSEAGKFKFKTVKGNGTESVGTVATADILWETYNNADDVTANSVIAEVSYADDYITFSTPETLKHGNALIAAKDADGKILWSWHIWIPKTVPGADLYGISSSKLMMDRNIGALDAPTKDSDNAENSGMFYQWGRKDPLRAVSSLADGTLVKTYPVNVWTTASTQIALESMHETPCVFVTDNTNWCSTNESTLWADTKTVNDPCPAGYKVPKYGETSLFDYFTIENYTGWSVNDDKYNFTIGTAESYAVFPYGHITRYGAYDLTDSKAWIWTATHKSESEPDNARAVTVKAVDSRGCSGQRKANGVYVRCVAEVASN